MLRQASALSAPPNSNGLARTVDPLSRPVPSALSPTAATFLRKIGIEVTFVREGRARTRTIRLTIAEESGGAQPSAPSAPPALVSTSIAGNGLAAVPLRTSRPARARGVSGQLLFLRCVSPASPARAPGSPDALP